MSRFLNPITVANLLPAALFAAMLSIFPPACFGQDYPTKAIRWIVPIPAGAPVDINARKFASSMSVRLGQPIVVENRPGAGGTIGAAEVARSPADGYTLLMTPNDGVTASVALIRNTTYVPGRDFTFITKLWISQPGVVASTKVKATNLKELVAEAKTTQGGLSYGSFGPGSFPQLIMETFAQKTGAPMLHVPYSGSPPALQDVLAGRVDVTFGSPAAVLRYVAEGRMKLLAQSGAARSGAFADVPTFIEQGLGDPIFLFNIWAGLLGPAGLPRVVVDKTFQAAKAVLLEPDFAQFLKSIASDPVARSPEEFRKEWQTEYDAVVPLIGKLGLTPN